MTAVLVAFTVVAAGAALRPRPAARTPVEPKHADRRRRTWLPTRRRAVTVDAHDVALWCESLARAVRGGSTLPAALRETAAPPAAGDAVDSMLLALARGHRLVDAIPTAATSPHLALAMSVIRACATSGGPPAEPLDRAATALRHRAADAAERRTQSAQARLSAVVLTVLPIAMLALLGATSPATRAAAASPIGIATIAAGVAFNIAGWRWMRRIINRVAS